MGTVFSPHNRGTSNTPNPVELLTGVACLVGAGILIWALVIAAELVFFSAAALVDTMLGLAPDGVISNIILSSIAGVFAGIAATTIRSLRRKPGSIEKSFVSALFSKGLAAPSLDGLFWAKVMLSTLVGLVVGALTGADGKLHAQSVRIFPESLRGIGEGQYPTDDNNPARSTTRIQQPHSGKPRAHSVGEAGKAQAFAAGTGKPSSYLDDLAPGGVRAAADFA